MDSAIEAWREPGDRRYPTVLIVAHSDSADGGRVASHLRRRGYGLVFCRPVLGQPLPAPERFAACVLLGGPMSANDDDLACIRAELDWLPRALVAEIPLLGICLGAQLLARVLGARVWRHPRDHVEVGFYPLHPTASARACSGAPGHAYQWHREGFDLPSGAALLARGSDCFPNQAFCLGRWVFGLQFHPEITARTMARWLAGGAERLRAAGAQHPALHWQGYARHQARVDTWLAGFCDGWLAGAGRGEPAPVWGAVG